MTNNSVAFQLDGLPTHKKIIVRARVFTECLSTEGSQQNTSVSIILEAGSPVNKILNTQTEGVIEAELVHSDGSLNLQIKFGMQD